VGRLPDAVALRRMANSLAKVFKTQQLRQLPTDEKHSRQRQPVQPLFPTLRRDLRQKRPSWSMEAPAADWEQLLTTRRDASSSRIKSEDRADAAVSQAEEISGRVSRRWTAATVSAWAA